MNRRQKLIVAILALADVLVIAAMGWAVFSRLSPVGPAAAPAAPAVLDAACAPAAVDSLAQAGLDGVVASGATQRLTLRLVHDLPAGRPVDDGAQSAWRAFEALVPLLDGVCSTAQEVEVVVTVVEGQGAPSAYLTARLPAVDLRAWGSGQLDDSSLATRVVYTRTEDGAAP